tara:strand:+ start:702 stop:983 length:282 start_codon:yes stop_codon:yes gene_type:complete
MACEDTDTGNVYNYFGLIGSTILSLSIILQVVKTHKNKSADDLSYRWLLSTVVGLTMVNAYAIRFDLWSLYIPGIIELLFVIILIFLKKMYDT